VISIQKVLAEIKITVENQIPTAAFSIKARYSEGKRIGEIYFKPEVRPYFKTQSKKSGKRNDFGHRLQSSDSLMLFDVLKNRPFTVPYFLLMEYKGQRVVHE